MMFPLPFPLRSSPPPHSLKSTSFSSLFRKQAGKLKTNQNKAKNKEDTREHKQADTHSHIHKHTNKGSVRLKK